MLQSIDDNSLETVKKLFEITTEKKELQQQFDAINESITRLRKNIIVYIDDVDRLDKKEVIEVLRIVRNTGNFGNIFFIVAFDKGYVTNSINESLQENSNNYLEKIFQLEYYLPVSPNTMVYQTELLAKIKPFVPADQQQILELILNPGQSTFGNFEILPRIKDFILNFRDVNRFMNVFLLNYERVKHNVYLPDYISVCMLRLKYPEVYQLLYYQKGDFLTTTNSTIAFLESERGELLLRVSEDGKTSFDNFVLYGYINGHQKELALGKEDVDKAILLVHTLFEATNRVAGFSGRRTFLHHHLTIADNFYFDRYFDFSLQGRLDQQEFDNALQLPLKELLAKIDVWNNARLVFTDLIIKFENMTVPANRVLFENMIKAIAYFTSLADPETGRRSHAINVESFYNKFGGKRAGNSVVADIYNGDEEALRQFFKGLYLPDQGILEWTFMQEFIIKLIEEYNDDFILTHAELKALLKESFMKLADNVAVFNNELLHYYRQVVGLFLDKSKNGAYIIPVCDGILMSQKLQSIIEKDVKLFLQYNIFPNRPGKGLALGDWDNVIYGSREIFNKFLERQKENPAVQEYLRFQEAFTKSSNPTHFEFNELSIQK